MATECRAKNPATCRMHGNPTISNLQAQADQAAVSGNVEEYLALRQKIDEAHDNSAQYHESLAQADVLQEQVFEAGAKACFDDLVEDKFDWSAQSRKTREAIRGHVEAALTSAEPYMDNGAETSTTVRVMQGVLLERMKDDRVAAAVGFKNNQTWVMAHSILRETRSLRQQLKAAKRNAEEAL